MCPFSTDSTASANLVRPRAWNSHTRTDDPPDIMRSELDIQGHRRWHRSVLLDDFLRQIDTLQVLVDKTNSPAFREFGEGAIRNSMGWGLYIEDVIDSLETEWQRDTLAKALTATSRPSFPHAPTLSHLRRARRWVLRSVLGSSFLGDHPKRQSLLRCVMTEYAKLHNNEKGTSIGLQTKEPVRSLAAFVEDATDMVRSPGSVAALSHAYSALLACTAKNFVDHKLAPFLGSSAIPWNRDQTWRQLNTYELRVETTQKRAYASNCFDTLLCKHSRDEDGSTKNCDEAAIFLAHMATLATTDNVVMEVMCLMLLEPRRESGVHDQGLPIPAHLDGPRWSASPTAAVLGQVLAFRRDARLWSIDAWLLTEVSHCHFAFADVYLAYILSNLRDLERQEINQGPADSLTARREGIREKLAMLSSRSAALKDLCTNALAQSSAC